MHDSLQRERKDLGTHKCVLVKLEIHLLPDVVLADALQALLPKAKGRGKGQPLLNG
jgi:hypothetical protein